jgi:hypothetical protein
MSQLDHAQGDQGANRSLIPSFKKRPRQSNYKAVLEAIHSQDASLPRVSVVVLGGFGCCVSCPNAVSSRVIHLVFHSLQHNCFSSLDSINMVYQHPSSA